MSVMEALDYGGLSDALDFYRPDALEQAATASKNLGLAGVEGLLAEAAAIARSHRGRSLDDAITTFDRRYAASDIAEELRSGIATHLREHPESFAPIGTGGSP